MFAVSPLPATASGGALTPQQVQAGEIWWAFKQAADLNQYTSEQLEGTTQWAVLTVDPSSGSAANAGINPYVGGTSIGTINAPGMSAGEVIAQLSSADNVVMFYPLVPNANAVAVASALDEPLFSQQWHLRNTGQKTGSPIYQDLLGVPGEDVNVVGAWNLGLTGEGVVVGIIDSGYQTNHPDLSVNNNAALNASFTSGANSHGTAVAGIIGANGNNNNGVVGIAYNVDLVNIDIGTDLGLNLTPAVINYRNDVIDIYNLSLGEADEGRGYVPLSPEMVFALSTAVQEGRPNANGVALGNIFVVASGNDGGSDFIGQGFATSGHWDSANYSGLVSSRYVIGVGAVDHDGTYFSADGTLTNYPEAGANVLVVAPTGSVSLDVGLDIGAGSGIWTTDMTGNGGYNQEGNGDGDFLEDANYTSRFNGTSAAAPMVTAVIALMLEANPNLTYRDVQEILVRSARQNDPTDKSWQSNLYESWERPAVAMGIPIEDPFLREDPITIIDLPGGPVEFNGRGGGSVLSPKPIDNYSLYQLPRFDNGAGYTVSDARGNFSEEYGWAHGVVDAELAVLLAKQWMSKGQDLAPELTYTTFVRPGNRYIPGAAKVGPEGNDELYIVPGVMVGGSTNEDDFQQFYAEFFADMPFDGDDPPVDDNGQPLPLTSATLPGFNLPAMQIEWVEVKLNVTGTDLNSLRVALRSPDGTVSDLNMFVQQNDNTSLNMNQLDQDLLRPGLPTAPNSETIVFSTNRHWGERSDFFAEINPETGLVVLDPDLSNPNPFPVIRTWDLIVENYDEASAVLTAFEVVFHGTPIGENTERISGNVGLDIGTADNPGLANDGEFNFDRWLNRDVNQDGTIDTRIVDPDQEAFASNITVEVRDTAQPNVIVDQFVTGADGNFYFDLAPGTYTVKALAPAGFSTLDDTGLDPRYQKVWTITIDPLDVFTRTAGRSHVIDDNQDGVQDTLDLRHSYYNDVDFLLDAGDLPSTTVAVSGFVFSDVNGDGNFNAPDTEAKNFHVYADVNNSGAFEQGEPGDFTDDDGLYSFTVPGITALQNIVIVTEPLTSDWTPTNPVSGRHTLLQAPGGVAENVNFGFRPPLNGNGDPGDPGTIIGIVFSDRNSNRAQDSSDVGVPGVRVYVDANANGVFDYTDANTNGQFDDGELSEVTDVTNDFGGFFLADVEPGIVRVRILVPTDWVLTAPQAGFFQATLTDGGQLNNVLFGIHNQATRDFGDLLGAGYNTTGVNAASHEIIAGFQLGARIDGEVDGQPTADAKGDDNITGDEDGVVLLGADNNQAGVLVAGTTNVVQVTVFGVGGYINAWMDFNKDGDFNDPGEHVPLSDGDVADAIVDLDINPGTRELKFAVPANLAAGSIPARFRWASGSSGLDYFGPANIGEVEDYLLPNINTPPIGSAVPGDYDLSGLVDNADYALWKSTFGSTTNLAADGNGNGSVDSGDYSVWRDHWGQSTPEGGGSSGLSTDGGGSAALSTVASVASNRTVRHSLTTSDPEYIALMQRIGATPVTLDFGAHGTRTIYVYNNASSAGQASVSTPDTVAAGTTAPAANTVGLIAAADGPIGLLDLQFTTTVTSPGGGAAVVHQSIGGSGSNSAADLLLVDQAVLRFLKVDDDDDFDATPIGERDAQGDGNLELALAAAFEDDSNWWLAL